MTVRKGLTDETWDLNNWRAHTWTPPQTHKTLPGSGEHSHTIFLTNQKYTVSGGVPIIAPYNLESRQ